MRGANFTRHKQVSIFPIGAVEKIQFLHHGKQKIQFQLHQGIPNVKFIERVIQKDMILNQLSKNDSNSHQGT